MDQCPRGDFPDINPTTYNVLVARDGLCVSAPATCKAMVDAMDRSTRLITKEPLKAFSLLAKRFDKMDPELLKFAFDSFQKNAPARPLPMGKAFDHTVEAMFGPQDDKAALKALAKSIHTDEFVNALK